MTKLFGTDGIRGTANSHPITADVILKLGMAAGMYFNRGGHRHRVVIAKDTRLSGYMLEPALTAGFTATGMDVVLAGPMPTPAVAMLVTSMRADLGVMISASHNPYQDNGIKLFGPDGYKLTDTVESEIEQLMKNISTTTLARPEKIGRATRLEGASGRYIEMAKATFPQKMTLEGLSVVLDCSHGAAYHVGPLILRELGANVTVIGAEPNGFNINQGCGSTAPESMCKMVRETGADIGIALDGDADRLIVADEHGDILDGDQLMGLIALHLKERDMLKGGAIVATVMSNMGLEQFLKTQGIGMMRSRVGDRYVIEEMKKSGCNLGGEQSGHIILNDFTTTGDGLIGALQVMAVLKEKGRPLSECGHVFEPWPQILKNVHYSGGDPLNKKEVKAAIAKVEKQLGKNGRVLVRKSGTEPVIRVMVEGQDARKIDAAVEAIATTIG